MNKYFDNLCFVFVCFRVRMAPAITEKRILSFTIQDIQKNRPILLFQLLLFGPLQIRSTVFFLLLHLFILLFYIKKKRGDWFESFVEKLKKRINLIPTNVILNV